MNISASSQFTSNAGGNSRRVVALFAEADKLGLRRIPDVRDLIEMIANDPEDSVIIELLEEKIAEEKEVQMRKPDPFRGTAPHAPDAVAGNCPVGRIVQTGYPYGIPSEMLNQHMLCLGRTGGGKTTVIKQILVPILRNTPDVHVMIIERKSEFRDIVDVRTSSPFIVIDFKHLRINLLRPPPCFRHLVWVTMLTQLMCHYLDIMTASSELITNLAMSLLKSAGVLDNPSLPHPDLRDLYNHIRAQKFPAISHEARYQETSANRISAMLNMLPGVFECRSGLDVSQIIDRDVLLLLHDIPNLNIQNFLIALITAQFFLYRIVVEGHQPQLRNLIVLDEASTLFRRTDDLHDKASYLPYMMTQARAYGIGIVAGSQSMSDLSNMLLANTGFKILVGGFEQGKDFQEFLRLRDTTQDQHRVILGHREPGHAFISDPRHPYLLECAIDMPDLPAPLSDEEVTRRSIEAAETLRWDLSTSRGPAVKPKEEEDGHKAKAKKAQAAKPAVAPEDPRIQVLRDIEARPFVRLANRAYDLKIRSTTLKTILDRLETDGLIAHYDVPGQAGRPRHLYEVTVQGYAALGKAKPALKGKGGYLHQFYQDQVAHFYRGEGYEVDIEGRAGAKNVDVLARKLPDGATFAIEIELHAKENQHWQQNILLDLAASHVSRVLCLVPDKDSLGFLVVNIAATPELVAVASRVTIDLLRNHMRID